MRKMFFPFIMCIILVSCVSYTKYEYRTDDFKERLTLYKPHEGKGTFRYTKHYKKFNKKLYPLYGNHIKKRPVTCVGWYRLLTDSTILINDTIQMRRMNIKEETKDWVKKDKRRFMNITGDWGTLFTYDIFDITTPGDTIVYSNVDDDYYDMSKKMNKFFIKLRSEYAPLEAITYPDYEIKDSLCNAIYFIHLVVPTINNDIWKITEDGIIPLSNDNRTYVNYTLKKKITRMVPQY